MNINELLDKLVSETETHTAAQNAWGSDGGKASDKARRAVDAEVKRMQDRIAELEKAAYAQTDKGPVLWSEVCQMEVDAHEFSRSSASSQGKRIAELERENEELKGLLEE